jgi:hypothetical protein
VTYSQEPLGECLGGGTPECQVVRLRWDEPRWRIHAIYYLSPRDVGFISQCLILSDECLDLQGVMHHFVSACIHPEMYEG